jgi:hypothetical protein
VVGSLNGDDKMAKRYKKSGGSQQSQQAGNCVFLSFFRLRTIPFLDFTLRAQSFSTTPAVHFSRTSWSYFSHNLLI